MAHWQNRPEAAWKSFEFNQPYAKGLKRLKEEVLAKTDFDPATLWQWGTMQAMAVIEILKTCERLFGGEGQQVVYEALHRVGLDIGRQILAGTNKPEELSDAEFVSFYATVINRIAYASLEARQDRRARPGQLRHSLVPAPGPLPGLRLPRAALLRAGDDRRHARVRQTARLRRALRQHDPGGRPDLPLHDVAQ